MEQISLLRKLGGRLLPAEHPFLVCCRRRLGQDIAWLIAASTVLGPATELYIVRGSRFVVVPAPEGTSS